jgi:hypothetical protein
VNENGNIKTLKPFQKGVSGNLHRGPNKVSTKVKESLVRFLEDNIDAVQESFDKLKPLEKLQFVANILPYVVPKLSAIESEANVKHSGGINIRWSEPGLLDSRNKGSNGELQSIQGGLQDNSEPGGNQIGEDLYDDPTIDSTGP